MLRNTYVDPLKGGVLLFVYQDALGQEENAGGWICLPHGTAIQRSHYQRRPLSDHVPEEVSNNWIAIDDYRQDAAIPTMNIIEHH